MLYETLFQTQIFFLLVYFGLLCGIFMELKILICHALKNNKIVKFILDISFMLLCALVFVYAKNLACYGEFRLYLLVGFVLGVILEHISIGFLVEKFFKLMYNVFKKVFRRMFGFRKKPKQKVQ